MIKVITYGTYDLLHYGHLRLLERAKALGDYLVVGVTSDDFDKTRGKINVQQSLIERMEAVRATGIADEIIVEEYEGQKIDDIRRMGIDIFTVGSDWVGKFDYLNEFCNVIYLPRTEGVSSSEIRDKQRKLRLGIIGDKIIPQKYIDECDFVNGVDVKGIYLNEVDQLMEPRSDDIFLTSDYDELLERIDAVLISADPERRFDYTYRALLQKKHVLCESPIALDEEQCRELFSLAEKNGCVLMEGIKTAYATAYNRILLLARDGRIGKIISIDATCTSLADAYYGDEKKQINNWNSIHTWGPYALLPIFQLLGRDYKQKMAITRFMDDRKKYDVFTKIDFIYEEATGSIKVAKGAKSEGELIISGTQGYIYVPSPWWKTDYFEVRYENQDRNKKYFYQLDGEGIRYEIVAFARAVTTLNRNFYISEKTSLAISRIMQDFAAGIDVVEI